MQILGYLNQEATEPTFTASGLFTENANAVLAAAISARPECSFWSLEDEVEGESDTEVDHEVPS